jgi:hypothetical protein
MEMFTLFNCRSFGADCIRFDKMISKILQYSLRHATKLMENKSTVTH